jgi:hypothetical protein
MEWNFPAPMGPRTVLGEFTMADVVTIPSHLSVSEVRTYMAADAVKDLFAPDAPAPAAVDERGRSSQTFVVDVITGVASAGEIFDAPAFLQALSPHIKLETDVVAR